MNKFLWNLNLDEAREATSLDSSYSEGDFINHLILCVSYQTSLHDTSCRTEHPSPPQEERDLSWRTDQNLALYISLFVVPFMSKDSRKI